MIDEAAPTSASQPEGTTGAATAAPAQPAPVPELTLTERVVSDAEAEIKKLAQELHDKIVALGGEHWIADISDELRSAKQAVEDAAEWVRAHFEKASGSNA